MTHFFSYITYKKVAKFALSGEPDNNQPFGNQAEGLFYWNFLKKEGFLKDLLYNLITIGLACPGKEEL